MVSHGQGRRATIGTYPSCQRCYAASAAHSGKTKGARPSLPLLTALAPTGKGSHGQGWRATIKALPSPLPPASPTCWINPHSTGKGSHGQVFCAFYACGMEGHLTGRIQLSSITFHRLGMARDQMM